MIRSRYIHIIFLQPNTLTATIKLMWPRMKAFLLSFPSVWWYCVSEAVFIPQEPAASSWNAFWAPLGTVPCSDIQGRGAAYHGLRAHGQNGDGHRPDGLHWSLRKGDLRWTAGTHVFVLCCSDLVRTFSEGLVSFHWGFIHLLFGVLPKTHEGVQDVLFQFGLKRSHLRCHHFRAKVLFSLRPTSGSAEVSLATTSPRFAPKPTSTFLTSISTNYCINMQQMK